MLEVIITCCSVHEILFILSLNEELNKINSLMVRNKKMFRLMRRKFKDVFYLCIYAI